MPAISVRPIVEPPPIGKKVNRHPAKNRDKVRDSEYAVSNIDVDLPALLDGVAAVSMPENNGETLVRQLRENIPGVRSAVNNQQADLANVLDGLKKKKAAADGLEGEKGALQAAIAELKANMQTLETQAKADKKALLDQQALASKAAGENEKLRDANTRLKSDNEALRKRVATLETDVQARKNECTGLGEEKKALQAEVADLRGKNQTLEENFAETAATAAADYEAQMQQVIKQFKKQFADFVKSLGEPEKQLLGLRKKVEENGVLIQQLMNYVNS
ncbi:hypothetical protein B0T25DRAFT_544200 [Lasiosphaeria hispida]|uniref:Uncharacterized protein n=1 Tax=Lasiosphaeria hispida TaxID=260671 RepID=A0AAJ0MEA7_9PEZI|nr:hypothetical protein B0T25DRAFT_544200 [Lasiosphaeria hispida]